MLLNYLFLENNLDGLQYTKAWLYKSFEKLKSENKDSTNEAAAVTMPTPASIMNEAYMQLLDWNPEEMFPEVSIVQFR